jgi:hypothetical protein
VILRQNIASGGKKMITSKHTITGFDDNAAALEISNVVKQIIVDMKPFKGKVDSHIVQKNFDDHRIFFSTAIMYHSNDVSPEEKKQIVGKYLTNTKTIFDALDRTTFNKEIRFFTTQHCSALCCFVLTRRFPREDIAEYDNDVWLLNDLKMKTINGLRQIVAEERAS